MERREEEEEEGREGGGKDECTCMHGRNENTLFQLHLHQSTVMRGSQMNYILILRIDVS